MPQQEELSRIASIVVRNALSNMHTILIARVVKVGTNLIDCQPVINRQVDGKSRTLPLLVDVPPIFLHGGTSYTAHPISIGDYALILINERCYDRWYSGQDEIEPLELRMHDYSDGFALVGVNPLAGLIDIPSLIQIQGDSDQQGNKTHTGNYTLTGDMTINGDLIVNGNIECDSFTCNGNGSFTGTVTASQFIGGCCT